MTRIRLTVGISIALLAWSLVALAAPGSIEVHIAGQATVAVVSGDDLVATGAVAKGARGCLIQDVAPGACTVIASASGYASASKAVTVPDGGEIEVSFELRKLTSADYKGLGRVVGLVKTKTGGAIVGATLLLLSGETVVGAARSSGDDGVYELEWYAPGEYTVVCQAAGRRRAVITSQRVTAGKSTRLDIELRAK